MKTQLHHGCLDHAWIYQRWPEFAALPEKDDYLVIVPVCGMADWGLGLPLDAEEVVAMTVLDRALAELGATWKARVLPPLRFVLAPYKEQGFFGVDPETAHQFLEEVCDSISEAGFSRVLFYNSSPWNEDLVDAGARDIRLSHHLQMFCINLSGLGLDVHPRSEEGRMRFQQAAVAAGLAVQEEDRKTKDENRETQAPLRGVSPLPLPVTHLGSSPEEAAEAGNVILAAEATHLASLLREVAARPPLPNAGVIPVQTT